MISVAKVEQAARIIREKIIRTPLVYSPTLSNMFGAHIYLKLENLQKTGSFKIRGATYKLLNILNSIGPQGVVAASAGNHAQGVALAARHAGVRSTIIMPEWVSISKQEATAHYGGEVIVTGQSVEESLRKAQDLSREGRTFIHPFDDPDIIAGQGTIGLEIFEDLNADLIIVPIGGGGLISGIASVVKQIRPAARVIGVESEVCHSAVDSLKKGKITEVDMASSLADGISVKQIGGIPFEVIRKNVDEVVLVAEDQIAAAVLLLLERKKVLAEGAGAVPVAACMSGSVEIEPDSKVVLVISGGNVDSPLLGRIIRQGLLKNGRIMRLRVRLEDIPGTLARLLTLVAALKANVLHIYHDRYVKGMPVNITYVELELETRSPAHVEEVAGAIRKAGYHMTLG